MEGEEGWRGCNGGIKRRGGSRGDAVEGCRTWERGYRCQGCSRGVEGMQLRGGGGVEGTQ